ncbi:hypothetical protein QYM36_010784 [Artemia franciscana]|uniref:C-type lectin domain-containing protein n=1 Tax=Artemia franciscana TaxID=6661 RepID=A0AA88HWH0_ARTSF|nr:hypothetical protein QYM36_010784 [Artemia franciscana]
MRISQNNALKSLESLDDTQIGIPDSYYPVITELPELQLEDLTPPNELYDDYDYSVEIEPDPRYQKPDGNILEQSEAATIATFTLRPTTTTTQASTTTTTETPTTQHPPAPLQFPPIERGDQSPPSAIEIDDFPPIRGPVPATISPRTSIFQTGQSNIPTTTSKYIYRAPGEAGRPIQTEISAESETQRPPTGIPSSFKAQSCPAGWSLSLDRLTKVHYCVRTINCTITCVEDALDACSEIEGQLETPIPRLKKVLEYSRFLTTSIKCKRHPVYCCKPGWSIFCTDNTVCSCYKRYDERPKHWKKGNNCCKRLNSTLVTIENHKENRFIAEFARQTVSDQHELIWLGFKRREKSTGYDSVIDEPPTYFNWASNAEKQGNCAAMVARTSKWTYQNCYKPKSVICEGHPYLWLDSSTATTTELKTESQDSRKRRRSHYQ